MKWEAGNCPELVTSHRDKESHGRDQEIGACRAESQCQATCVAFSPVGPEALMDVRCGIQGLRHWWRMNGEISKIGPPCLPVIQFTASVVLERLEEINGARPAMRAGGDQYERSEKGRGEE
jgi:hypothetical protein